MTEKLEELYYNPESGFMNLKTLIQQAKQFDIPENKVRQWYSKQKVAQIVNIPDRQ